MKIIINLDKYFAKRRLLLSFLFAILNFPHNLQKLWVCGSKRKISAVVSNMCNTQIKFYVSKKKAFLKVFFKFSHKVFFFGHDV